jgi:hypothetical protein
MRQLVLSLVLLCLPVLSAQADEARNPAIETVIQQQFDAFRAEDVGTAFSFASPNIKGMFGTPENFGRMVRDGYPMVWRPAEVQFLDLRKVAGNLWQRVMVTDQAGRTHLLEYQMVETGQGWQINGVQILPQAGVGA